jgi:plastocyanin
MPTGTQTQTITQSQTGNINQTQTGNITQSQTETQAVNITGAQTGNATGNMGNVTENMNNVTGDVMGNITGCIGDMIFTGTVNGTLVGIMINMTGSMENMTGSMENMTGSMENRTGKIVDISIEGFAFNPSSIEIFAGDNVRWTNLDTAEHTVTGPTFSSGNIPIGQSYAFQFTTPGTYEYVCSIHPFMKGTVVVVEKK